MINSTMLDYLRPMPSKPLPKVQALVQHLDAITRAAQTKVPETSLTYGERVLTDVMMVLDWSLLFAHPHALRIIDDHLPVMESKIDPVNGKLFPAQLFCDTPRMCYELIVPTGQSQLSIVSDDQLPAVTWDELRPLRAYAAGDFDFTTNTTNGYIVFRECAPAYVVYALDCRMLAIHYLVQCRAAGEILPLDKYLRYHVTTRKLLGDFTCLWLKQFYQESLLRTSPLVDYTTSLWDGIHRLPTSGVYRNARDELEMLRQRISDRSVDPLTALSSLPVDHYGISLLDYYRHILTHCTVPASRPYGWMECLANITWYELVIGINSHWPERLSVRTFHRRLTRRMYVWLLMRPWTYVRTSLPFRSMVERKLTGMYDYLSQQIE